MFQGKVRGKNASNRAPQPNIGVQQQQQQQQQQQMMQGAQTAILAQGMTAAGIPVVGSAGITLSSGTGTQTLTPLSQPGMISKGQAIAMPTMNQIAAQPK